MKTKVIFRRWKNQSKTVIALFPYEATDFADPYLCSSYESYGGHGSADLLRCIYATKPAHETEKDVIDLYHELDHRGYDLQVQHRVNHSVALAERRKQLA